PLEPLPYIARYFAIQEAIHFRTNGRLFCQICAINVVLTIKIAHFLYLAFAYHLTDLDHTIHFDALFLMIPHQKYNLVVALCVLMAVYYNRVLFLRSDYALNVRLKNV